MMKEYKNKYIRKILKLNKYEELIRFDLVKDEGFYEDYLHCIKNYGSKKNQTDFKHFYGFLSWYAPFYQRMSECYLYQESNNKPLIWKYFHRAAFWYVIGNLNSKASELIDHFSRELYMGLLIEDKELVCYTLNNILADCEKGDAQEKWYKTQSIYPKTYFLHFLLEKWLGKNPVLPRLFTEFTYKKAGYGIYQPIVDNWADLTLLPADYWSELCDYHLKGLSLYSEDKWENEESLLEGIIPMELLNLIKVRRKLGLDIPVFHHELFTLPTAREPVVPTGYNPDTDVLFQLVKRTAENKRLYTIEEVIGLLKEEYGEDVDYFL